MRNITYLFLGYILLTLLVNCSTIKFNDLNCQNTDKMNSLDSALLIEKQKIFNNLRRNRFNIKNCKIVYGIYYFIGSNKNICSYDYNTFQNRFFKNEFNINFVVGYIVNSEGMYIAKSTHYCIIKNPIEISGYKIDNQLIHLALENQYDAFIKIICKDPIVIGYSKYRFDIYSVKDEVLVLNNTINKY